MATLQTNVAAVFVEALGDAAGHVIPVALDSRRTIHYTNALLRDMFSIKTLLCTAILSMLWQAPQMDAGHIAILETRALDSRGIAVQAGKLITNGAP
jgi:hypothetical protein